MAQFSFKVMAQFRVDKCNWVAWNIPPFEIIPSRLSKGSIIEAPIYIEQGIAYGKHCYRGPKTSFNLMHRYQFTVYALDIKLQLDTNSKKSDLLKAINGNIIAKGELVGKYQRKHNS